MVRIVTGNDNSPNIACPHSQGREIYELPVNEKKGKQAVVVYSNL